MNAGKDRNGKFYDWGGVLEVLDLYVFHRYNLNNNREWSGNNMCFSYEK